MVQVIETSNAIWTAADLAERFGAIPMNRVRTDPPPGQGTEENVIDFDDREDRLYELIDGVLLEKTMGAYESYLGGFLLRRIGDFAEEHDLGIVLGADGMLQLFPGRVRLPDVCFISKDQNPLAEIQRHSIAELVPDLVVEVISPSNTAKELNEKLHDYFQCGTSLVWYVYPSRQEISVYLGPDGFKTLTKNQTITGGEVLPGFQLELKKLFAGPTTGETSTAGGGA